MSRITFATRGALLIPLAAILFGVGCAPVQAEPLGPPSAAPAYGPAPAYGEAPATAPEGVSDDVAYDETPPVDDIETYPSVIYDGVPVYYFGGMWYRHDSRGWGTYRHEPQELSRQRGQHERDPRWVQAGEGRPPQGSRTGAAERQPTVDNRSRPSPRQGITERQPAQSRSQEVSRPAAQGQPGAGHPATAPAVQPQQRKKVQPGQSVPTQRGKAPVRGNPAPAAARGSEHR